MQPRTDIQPATTTTPLSGLSGPESKSKPIVLVVENDPFVSAILWTLLTHFGFEVVSETSGPIGRQLARRLSPDVVVLNVNLQDINGLEICHQLKADPETSALPVVFCSGQRYLADEAMELGAAAFLDMPSDISKLPNCLRQILFLKPTISLPRNAVG